MKADLVKEGSGAALVAVSGEVDMYTSPDVRNVLTPLFKSQSAGIVVDLSGVTYMDSSGIATMIEGLQWSTKEGKRFIIAGLQEKVKDVFVLTNLHEVFEFAADPEGAYTEIAGG